MNTIMLLAAVLMVVPPVLPLDPTIIHYREAKIACATVPNQKDYILCLKTKGVALNEPIQK